MRYDTMSAARSVVIGAGSYYRYIDKVSYYYLDNLERKRKYFTERYRSLDLSWACASSELSASY